MIEEKVRRILARARKARKSAALRPTNDNTQVTRVPLNRQNLVPSQTIRERLLGLPPADFETAKGRW